MLNLRLSLTFQYFLGYRDGHLTSHALEKGRFFRPDHPMTLAIKQNPMLLEPYAPDDHIMMTKVGNKHRNLVLGTAVDCH